MGKRPGRPVRSRSRFGPKDPTLVVITMTCDDPACGGECIPPWYRKRAVPVSDAEWLSEFRPRHAPPPPGREA